MNIFRTFALGITMVGLMMPHATQAEENTATARFFYSETYPTCHVMRAYMDQVCALNPDVPIEMLDTSVNPEAWQSACEGAGIPVWGVPRMFIQDRVFADWSDEEGELVYIPSYYGYMGYRNQVIDALEAAFGELKLPDEEKSDEP